MNKFNTSNICNTVLWLTNVFLFHCSYIVQTLDESFQIGLNQPSGWIHVVLNYIGSTTGQGIRIYHDGVQAGSDDTHDDHTFPSGDGRVLVGRYESCGVVYTAVDIDELLFFNEKISDQEIMKIMNFIWIGDVFGRVVVSSLMWALSEVKANPVIRAECLCLCLTPLTSCETASVVYAIAASFYPACN